MINKHDFFAIMHSLVILLAWSSPFWLDWKIILGCLIIFNLQIIFFRSCVITNLQFKKNIKERSDMTMYTYWIERFGGKINREKMKFISSYVMPNIILLLTILWQILLNHNVWLKI